MRRAWLALLLVAGCRQVFGLDDPIPRDASTADAPTDAPPGYVTIGGEVTGLTGTGLVLQDNGTNDHTITSNGPFQFIGAVAMGSSYAVNVSQQPTLPSQVCTVANAAGTANGNVTDVTVICATSSYTISGTVYGMPASKVVSLELNGGGDIMVTSDGSGKQSFTFPNAVDSGDSFLVTVSSQPSQGSCAVSGGSGVVGSGNVTAVAVNCAPNTYTISGTVQGLNGSVTLSDGTDTTATSNNAFAFPPVTAGTTYTISVVSNPAYPPVEQTCVVTTNSSGIVTTNVTNVVVSCSTNSYTIGGTVYELGEGSGSGAVTLENNGEPDSLIVSGPFTFPTPVASGMTYDVTVQVQPPLQTCLVSAGTGTVTSTDVSSVEVMCDSGVSCGGIYCNPATSGCCDPEGTAPSCKQAGQCITKLFLPCQDANDCTLAGQPGTTCCATMHNNAVMSVACMPTCVGMNLVMCDPNQPPTCPVGMSCQPFAVLPGYYACQ